jgi:hypothetical protein
MMNEQTYCRKYTIEKKDREKQEGCENGKEEEEEKKKSKKKRKIVKSRVIKTVCSLEAGGKEGLGR